MLVDRTQQRCFNQNCDCVSIRTTMGKSAGKWIKNVLFGKKYSKSNLPKSNTAEKWTSEKNPEEDLTTNSPVISNPCDIIPLSPLDQDGDSHASCLISISDADKIRQEQAATKAQAAIRGYLARRAFRALKGIIRLQALIRGHLVRRQAIATFRCTLAIVKIQALVRKAVLLKIATNVFVQKLLLKMSTAMPLRLQYNLSEPNAVWNWLERWSVSRFWDTPVLAKTTMKGKQVSEFEGGKSRRTIRKFLNGVNGARKVGRNQTELEEQPQNELERVKNNLRKISASAAAAFEKSRRETGKSQSLVNAEKETNSAPLDVSEQEKLISSEVDLNVLADKPKLLEAPLDLTLDEPIEVPFENGLKMVSSLTLNDELNCKEENGKDNHKIGRRRSLPAKKDCSENISQNTRSLPSYMAATESAKAKLRAQASRKFDEQGTEYGIGRRHSLPASTNGKWSSLSPGMQKHVLANGKGGDKINKSLMITRDDKVIQPGWRR